MSGKSSTTADERLSSVRDRIQWIRTGQYAPVFAGVTFLLALPLAAVHWLGLVAGGALLGLTASSLRRALVLGAYLGVAVALAFVVWLWFNGVLGKAIATGTLFGLSLAVAVVFPILGSSVRGLG